MFIIPNAEALSILCVCARWVEKEKARECTRCGKKEKDRDSEREGGERGRGWREREREGETDRQTDSWEKQRERRKLHHYCCAMSSLFPLSKIYALRFATVKWSPCLWYQGAEKYDDSHFSVQKKIPVFDPHLSNAKNRIHSDRMYRCSNLLSTVKRNQSNNKSYLK